MRQEWLLRFLEHRNNDASRSKFTDLDLGSTLVLMGRRLGDEITLTSGFAKHSKRRPARLDRGEADRVGTTLSAADPMADHCPSSGEAIQQTTETRR